MQEDQFGRNVKNTEVKMFAKGTWQERMKSILSETETGSRADKELVSKLAGNVSFTYGLEKRQRLILKEELVTIRNTFKFVNDEDSRECRHGGGTGLCFGCLLMDSGHHPLALTLTSNDFLLF